MLFLCSIILVFKIFHTALSSNISISSCVLPAFPENGRYSLANQAEPAPGDEVSKPAVLQYSCNPDFILNYELSLCQGNNVWTPIPTCTKACKLFASYTVDYTCYSSKNLEMTCQPNMPHGSSVLFECKTGHTLSRTQTLDEMRCNDGSWSVPLPECDTETTRIRRTKDCGLEIADGATFIINAPIAKKDTLPWHVAVYQKQAQLTFICGGTILSTKLVISAAHCFYDANHKRKMPAEQFCVAANKHFQSWDHPGEVYGPKSEILEIRLHEWYTGELHHQQNDMALLVLKTPFTFSDTVGAICYDFVNQRFDRYQLSASSNVKAKFAGWGVTEKERTAQELRVLSVPFIDQRMCIDEYEKYHSERYITADKICAGYTNGSTGCNGDSGAGLVFPYPQGGELRWWLRGVLSVGPRDGFSCRSNTYTAFTRVFALRDWIKPQINEILSQREIYKVPEVAARTVGITRSGCPLPELPSHGKYIILGCHQDELVPGDPVLPPTHLKYFCDVNYKASQVFSECLEDGSWSPSPVCNTNDETGREETGREETGGGDPETGREETGNKDPESGREETGREEPETGREEIGPGYSANGCILPEFPKGGQYAVPNIKDLKPGDWVPEFTFLNYSCQDGYELSLQYTACEDSKWSGRPTCSKKCKMVTSITVEFECFSGGFSAIPCTDKLPDRTIVMPACKKGHIPKDYLENLICIDGSWDYPTPSCKPVCGTVSESSPALISSMRDRTVKPPWHVGIYQQEGKEMKQICGGSLIHSNIVISAAHCFWDPTKNEPFPAINFKVAVQKTNRKWDDKTDDNVYISEVTQILLHEVYGGDAQNQQADVALLQLTTPLILSASLYPLCYDLYDAYLDALQTHEGFIAQVFSWGREETGEPSQKLKSMTFPIVNTSQCRDELSKYGFARFLTSDKMCAGYINGSTALCQGDSGAGLVVPTKVFTGETKWYLRGIVSTGPLTNGSSECWSTYTLVTQMYKLRHWLSHQLQQLT